MWVLFDNLVKARKDYRCDAYERIMDVIEDGYFNYAELRSIVRMKRQGGLIKKGQQYRRQVNTFDGVGTFRADPGMDAICHKYNLYEEV